MLAIYQTDEYRRWFSALKDRAVRAHIDARIRRISLGNFGDTKRLSDRLFEIRLHLGPGYRIYAERRDTESVILLCGGDKATQKRDIARAKRIAGKQRNSE